MIKDPASTHRVSSFSSLVPSWNKWRVICRSYVVLYCPMMDGWMNGVLGHFFCTTKAELGWGQPGLMRWSWDETLPQCSIDRSTLYIAAHCATSELAAAPCLSYDNAAISIQLIWGLKLHNYKGYCKYAQWTIQMLRLLRQMEVFIVNNKQMKSEEKSLHRKSVLWMNTFKSTLELKSCAVAMGCNYFKWSHCHTRLKK